MDEDALEPPPRMGITIPPHAEQALLKAMSVKAGDRFQEMEMFQQALMREPEKTVEPAKENSIEKKQEDPSQNEEKKQASPSHSKINVWIIFSVLLVLVIVYIHNIQTKRGHGWLGVGFQDLTQELAEHHGLSSQEGVLVIHVFEGDPAEKKELGSM